MADGATVTQTAKDLGLGRRTVSRWKAEPEFNALVESIMSERRARWSDCIDGLRYRSAQVLRSALRGDKVNATQLRVALHLIPAASSRTYYGLYDRGNPIEAILEDLGLPGDPS